MPIPDNIGKYTVESTFQGVANTYVYSEGCENAINKNVGKLNKSIFGNKTPLNVSVTQSSLATVHDSNIDFVSDSGTKAGFVKNLTGLYEMSSYEASIDVNHKGNTYQTFATLDGSVGAGVKFKNGDRISGAYTLGSGAELAYSTNTGITQTKTGVFYDQNRNSVGLAGIVRTQSSSNVSFEGGASLDTKGNWSASVSTNISQQNSNIKLNAGVQSDFGTKSGFVGAIITF